ncbi:MAG: FAD-dependent oxidoreductase [Oscillospiraceae bacterium]|nr:FAD-dependent oxidoreductase [Oscillospiraceae bacterium]MCI9549105.1 FAD-dependent oxidoreductase [Oscillospiraceae bacterium]
MRYAIIGFGTAGYHAAQAIRERDKAGEIVVYGDTGLAPYNPMLTTYYIFGKLPRSGLFPFGPLEAIADRLGLAFRHERVVKVRARDLTVETEGGVERFDKILIATGATAFAPPVKGLAEEDSFLMRTVDDAQRLKDRLDRGDVKSAVVVGASMAGIKVVEVLEKYGVQVCLADLAPHIFPLAAYPEVSAAIERRVAKRGIDLRFGATIDHMEVREGKNMAVMTDGAQVPADLVSLCIGTRAATQVVQGEVEIDRGILIDESMETSAPGVYAAGDCAQGANLESGERQIIGLWANANRQGAAAGANMAGGAARFEGNILHNITHFMDMDFIGFGDNRIQGELLEQGSLDGDGLYVRAVVAGGKVAGANILDSYRISGILKNYMLRLFTGEGGGVPDYQRAMLLQAGLRPEFIDRMEAMTRG